MDFLGIGPLELVLILFVLLIAFGPARLPEMARQAGKTMRKFRTATTQLTREIEKELAEEKREANLSVAAMNKVLHQAAGELDGARQQLRADILPPAKPQPPTESAGGAARGPDNPPAP